ncbi:type II methionyl aminopeptidase [archaeon]|nr:type II methionyl aminopeptidase [archaeon]
MEKETADNYVKAGKIAAEVREASRDIVTAGKGYMEIVEKIEKMIRDSGGEPAFPVNISVNDIAAHHTPTKNDTTIVKDNDIVKIDVGVHVDGYIADTAVTVNLNKDYIDLVKAAESALEEAIKVVKPGVLLSDVSTVIEETIKGFGYKPIDNLTGHGLNRFDLHTEPTVPNVSFASDYTLKENQVIAIEPFATDGGGHVKDSENVFIFGLIEKKPVRNAEARKIIDFADSLNGLPFAERWLPIDSLFKIRLALRELRERGVLHDYYVLREAKGGMVSQAEHTLIVKDKPIIITK